MHIVHLAFEDHLRPGSGGGAIRTREINRRLAHEHQITVLAARYPGCQSRTEAGVRYEHIGFGNGYTTTVMSYFASIPLALRRFPADLIVEDFAAPFSSSLAPLWTRTPVVAVVQWLFAREKSRQYKLPFFLVESAGVRLYRQMVAVSEGIATRLRSMNRQAAVHVIPNGLDQGLLEHAPPVSRRGVLYLGRLEIHQKGLDLLLQAFSEVRRSSDVHLTIAGDGPDAARLRELSNALGLERAITYTGRLEGAAKASALRSAELVMMPSRYESFGIVALESLACGTPVVAFDISSLREILPASAAVLVEPFDTRSLADATVELLADSRRRSRMASFGQRLAAAYTWDAAAASQETAYVQALG